MIYTLVTLNMLNDPKTVNGRIIKIVGTEPPTMLLPLWRITALVETPEDDE